MNKASVKYIFFFSIISFSLTIKQLHAQTPYDFVSGIMQTGNEEPGIILENYLMPLGKAWGSGVTGGWYNTAKTHKTGSFDIMFSLHYAKAPDVDKIFDLSTLELQKIQSTDANQIVPTIINSTDTASINILPDQVNPLLTEPLSMKGYELSNSIPLPSFNISMGIIQNTDLMARLIPNTSFRDYGNINSWGIGIMHDFMQWGPLYDLPFDGSVHIAYSRLKLKIALPYEPTADFTYPDVELPENQDLSMKVNTFTSNIILSKEILFFTPYLSAGFTSTNFNVDLMGTYYIPTPESYAGDTRIVLSNDYIQEDPVSINPFSGVNTQFSAGLSVKLLVLTMHVQYTMHEYNFISAGVGLSFR